MKAAVLTLVASLSVALAACGAKPAGRNEQLSGQALKDETQRCAHGGADTARDPSCKAVREQNFDQFMGGSQKR